MTDQLTPSQGSAVTSTGHELSESSWLDGHFETLKPEYEGMVR